MRHERNPASGWQPEDGIKSKMVVDEAQNSLPGCGGKAGWRVCVRGICDCLRARLDAGAPLPPLTTISAEAEEWAIYASVPELKHYVVAAWRSLSPRDRDAFLRWAVEQRRTA